MTEVFLIFYLKVLLQGKFVQLAGVIYENEKMKAKAQNEKTNMSRMDVNEEERGDRGEYKQVRQQRQLH